MTVQYLVQCKSCKCTCVANYPSYDGYVCDDCLYSFKTESKSTEEE